MSFLDGIINSLGGIAGGLAGGVVAGPWGAGIGSTLGSSVIDKKDLGTAVAGGALAGGTAGLLGGIDSAGSDIIANNTTAAADAAEKSLVQPQTVMSQPQDMGFGAVSEGAPNTFTPAISDNQIALARGEAAGDYLGKFGPEGPSLMDKADAVWQTPGAVGSVAKANMIPLGLMAAGGYGYMGGFDQNQSPITAPNTGPKVQARITGPHPSGALTSPDLSQGIHSGETNYQFPPYAAAEGGQVPSFNQGGALNSIAQPAMLELYAHRGEGGIPPWFGSPPEGADSNAVIASQQNSNKKSYAYGGAVASFAHGGAPQAMRAPAGMQYAKDLPGRLINGAGDGKSDSIPAVIDGKSPARIASGEYIIPAKAVSAIGNGSTEAGAKKLDQLVRSVVGNNKLSDGGERYKKGLSALIKNGAQQA